MDATRRIASEPLKANHERARSGDAHEGINERTEGDPRSGDRAGQERAPEARRSERARSLFGVEQGSRDNERGDGADGEERVRGERARAWPGQHPASVQRGPRRRSSRERRARARGRRASAGRSRRRRVRRARLRPQPSPDPAARPPTLRAPRQRCSSAPWRSPVVCAGSSMPTLCPGRGCVETRVDVVGVVEVRPLPGTYRRGSLRSRPGSAWCSPPAPASVRRARRGSARARRRARGTAATPSVIAFMRP